jgi:uncharacterized membrane protein YfcA
MGGIVIAFFLLAAFAGGFASGLAGFAMGFIVSGVWLHILTPLQTTALIVGYGLLTQGYGVWKLRHALTWKGIAPFIIGGMIGIPIGTVLLTYLDPAYLRIGVGALLLIYGTYGLVQPALKPLSSNRMIDSGIGVANGVLAGLTGLPGFIITVWCQLRGWKKDVQRTIFQPVMLAAMAANLVSLSIAGAITADVLRLYLLGLPAMVAGLWIGFKLYGKLDDAAFRKVILVLLLLAGLGLIVPRVPQALADDTCRPALAIGDVRFTQMQPPTRSRTWSAVVSVDASRCPAKATGTFDIVFVRASETASDLEFRERFVWRAPSVHVQVDLAADEAVQSYRIDNVTSCVCGG